MEGNKKKKVIPMEICRGRFQKFCRQKKLQGAVEKLRSSAEQEKDKQSLPKSRRRISSSNARQYIAVARKQLERFCRFFFFFFDTLRRSFDLHGRSLMYVRLLKLLLETKKVCTFFGIWVA